MALFRVWDRFCPTRVSPIQAEPLGTTKHNGTTTKHKLFVAHKPFHSFMATIFWELRASLERFHVHILCYLFPVIYPVTFTYSLISPSFFTLLLAYHKPGEGRVLSRTRIRDSYPWLRPETYEILNSLIKLNNQVLISLSYFSLDITFTLYSHWYTIFAFPSGSCK